MMSGRANAALARALSATPLDPTRCGRVDRSATARIPADAAQRLDALASRINRNVPLGSDPERFHVEKSAIARELRSIADELRR